MASNYVLERAHEVESVREIAFAGDGVRLSGQIDYPHMAPRRSSGYPLIFILHHAGCNTREAYSHYAQAGLSCGYAVFRWDKRGTGRSGAGGRGSTTLDAVLAYETALEQPHIDPRRAVILAQNEGTLLLGDSFGLFARLQRPHGVILAGNMLDARAILAIDAPVQVVLGQRDWNDWSSYAREACAAHNQVYPHGASYYVAPDADRRLMIGEGSQRQFHHGAERIMRDWLLSL
jgi:uncharacterized protein